MMVVVLGRGRVVSGRQDKRRRAAERQIRPTSRALRDGLPGPGPYRLRLARPGDAPAIAELASLAGVIAEPELLAAVEAGQLGGAAAAFLDTKHAGSAILEQHIQARDLMAAVQAMTVVLVAARLDAAEPVGVCWANPPIVFIRQVEAGGGSLQAQKLLLLGVARVPVLAIDPAHRGNGLGRGLLTQVAAVAHQFGARFVYGQTRESDGLLDWYRRAGFRVLPAGRGLDVTHLTGIRATALPGTGERFFVSGIQDPPRPAT